MKKKRPLVTEVMDDFLEYSSIEKKLDEKTIRAYKSDLQQCISLVGNGAIDQLTKEKIRTYIKDISHFRHKTIKRKLASLNAMLNYFEWNNEWYVNPTRKMHIHMREPVRYPTVMTIEEVRKMIDVVKKRARQYPNDSFSYGLAKRNEAIIELLFASGMRVSELCDLKVCDVDLNIGRIRIIGKGNKERFVDICQDETQKALSEWLECRDRYVDDAPFFCSRLGRKMSQQSVRLLVRQLTLICGIKKHVTPHTFRHTFATLLLEEDVDIVYIQHLLGHSSIMTTQIYTHVNLHKQREILQAKHPRRKI